MNKKNKKLITGYQHQNIPDKHQNILEKKYYFYRIFFIELTYRGQKNKMSLKGFLRNARLVSVATNVPTDVLQKGQAPFEPERKKEQ